MNPVQGVDHIGIAVHSIEAHRAFYEGVLGARFEGVEEVPDQKVKVAFFALGTGASAVRLEVLEPMSPESPIAQFIDKRGEGLHHVAYAVTGLKERLERLARDGLRLIDPVPRRGARGSMIAFIHPKSSLGVLTELCEHDAAAHA